MTHRSYNEQRFTRVLTYLHRHYAQELDLNRLAEEACLSPYHWHRIYHAVMGETIHATLKRIRLHRAAVLLGESHKDVAQVAREVGYQGNPQSFARIFREHYGQSPQQYRESIRHLYTPQSQPASYPVEIRHIEALPVLALAHHGDFMAVGDSFHRLHSLMQLRNQLPAQARFFGIFYNCPASVEKQDDLRSHACILNAVDEAQAPIERLLIPAGRYAVMRHRGPYAHLERAYIWFYEQWLLKSDHEVGEPPPFEEYLNDNQTTPPQELLTDIYIPIRD